MIKQKLKICNGCQKEKRIWSKGLCIECDMKINPEKYSIKKTGLKNTKRKRINPISDKQKERNREYLKARTIFLNKIENKLCRVYPDKRANQIHHMKGRLGSFLLDERFWLPVSPEGHKFIEENPKIAREKGWSMIRI